MTSPRKPRKLLLPAAAGACALLLVLFVCAKLPGPDFQAQMERNRRAAIEADFNCPKGSSEVIEPWGKVGTQRFCIANGFKHGPWGCWENGSHLRGQYTHGKQEGEWQWFDRGSLTRTIRYTDGIKTYDSHADAAW